MKDLIKINNIIFSYSKNEETLRIPFFQLKEKEKILLCGESGTGKTTLLNLITGILEPESGSIQVLEQDIHQMKPAQRDRFRGVHIGYIFQTHNLIPFLSNLDNILLPIYISGRKVTDHIKSEARHLAASLQILDLLEKKPSHLSMGQRQRVAAARALTGNPEIIIADEPTASLDAKNKELFLELLFQTIYTSDAGLILSSHDHSVKSEMDRTFDLSVENNAKREDAA